MYFYFLNVEIVLTPLATENVATRHLMLGRVGTLAHGKAHEPSVNLIVATKVYLHHCSLLTPIRGDLGANIRPRDSVTDLDDDTRCTLGWIIDSHGAAERKSPAGVKNTLAYHLATNTSVNTTFFLFFIFVK